MNLELNLKSNLLILHTGQKGSLTESILEKLNTDLDFKLIFNVLTTESNIICKELINFQNIIILFNEYHGNLPYKLIELFHNTDKKHWHSNTNIFPINVCGGSSGTGSVVCLFSMAQSLDLIIFPRTSFLNVHEDEFNFQNAYEYCLYRLTKFLTN
jgi:hypothetical protein